MIQVEFSDCKPSSGPTKSSTKSKIALSLKIPTNQRVRKVHSEFFLNVNLEINEAERFMIPMRHPWFVRESLERMKSYESMILANAKDVGVPAGILAVPMVESGFQNLPENPVATAQGAGIWQFIASTARVHGLRVDDEADERLNVVLETGAAMRLFKQGHQDFGTWQLSLLNYAWGAQRLRSRIEETGSRDPWVLSEAAPKNWESRYLANVMAAILIVENRETLF